MPRETLKAHDKPSGDTALTVTRRGAGAAIAAIAGALFALPALAVDQPPGRIIHIRVQDLSAPYATPSVANSPDRIPRPEGSTLRVPKGFSVNIFAENLSHARWMTVAANGDVFLAESSAGKITLLRDGDGDGRAELVTTFAKGFSEPHGLALARGYLYIADTRRVWRIPYRPGQRRAQGGAEPVTPRGALGSGGGHWTRNIAFSPEGELFYVAIGSASNIAEEPEVRASVQEFAADGSGQRTFASGLRNPVGIAFYPGTNDLYVVVNERDGLGDELVPDYLTRVRRGGFYGWPYSYVGSHPQPGYAHRRPELVKRAIVPDVLFRSHSAPLGLVFYDAERFPREYKGDAFVALHGSWNADVPRGYTVVRVPFAGGRPKGHYEIFASGFWAKGEGTAAVWGRPAGLAVAIDGSLLVADDVGDVVWRISHGL